MKLDEILSKAQNHKKKKRLGRGNGSGTGKTCGRGHKGYGSRSGSRSLFGYEGGQNPAVARLPKIGFSNFLFRKEFQCVNVDDLQRVFDDGQDVDKAALIQARLVDDCKTPVKILGRGELTKKFNVSADKFSDSAKKKISDAGGTIVE